MKNELVLGSVQFVTYYVNESQPLLEEIANMSTVAQLLAQKAALEAQIEAAQKAHVAEGIAQVKAIIAEYSLTKEDVFGDSAKRGRKASGSVAPKYKDPISGATWTGRGKAPKWIEGQDRNKFAIA